MIKKFEQYNEIDPYGEEQWDRDVLGDIINDVKNGIKFISHVGKSSFVIKDYDLYDYCFITPTHIYAVDEENNNINREISEDEYKNFKRELLL